MGNPKQKWTSEEEEALRAGVAKHGTGKWKNIQKDPEFNPFLYSRSNIDLKDKWRNMSVSSNGQGPREKSRMPKTKANPDVPTTPSSSALIVAPVAPAAHDASADAIVDDFSLGMLDGKNAPGYNAMIFDALSTLKEPNGSDTAAILNFVEQHRPDVLPTFRRSLSSRLKRLVSQDKLEKIQNSYYRIKKDALNPTKAPITKPTRGRLQGTPYTSSIEEASKTAAYKVAEAENRSFVAAEAVRESERVSKMAEDTDSFLLLAKEISEKCSHGEVMVV